MFKIANFKKFIYITIAMIALVTLFNNGVLLSNPICSQSEERWCELGFVLSWFFLIYPILHAIITYIALRLLKIKYAIILAILSFVIFYSALFLMLGSLGQANQLSELVKLYFAGILAGTGIYVLNLRIPKH